MDRNPNMNQPPTSPDHNSTNGNSTNGNGMNGNGMNGNGTHVYAPAPPEIQLPASDSPALGILPILSALRRRWFLAVSLGLVFGAVATGVAWNYIPAPYTAFSEIRILSVDPMFFYKVENGSPKFQTYKQTQMRLVSSPYVLLEAIRDPAVAKLSTIRDEEHPIRMLEYELDVSSPAEEFIKISLSGSNPAHMKEIVEAVTKSYLKEVVDKDEDLNRQRLNQLEKVYSTENADLETMKSRYRSLSEDTRTANSPQRDKRQEHLLDMHMQLRKELAHITMDRINAEIELKVRDAAKDSESDKLDIPDQVIDLWLERHPEFQQALRRLGSSERLVTRNKKALSPNHKTLIDSEKKLVEAQEAVDVLRKSLKGEVIEQIGAEMTNRSTLSDSQLHAKLDLLLFHEKELKTQLDEIKIQEKKTGGYNVLLEDLDKDINHKEQIVHAMLSEIEHIRIEFNAHPRIQLFRSAELPVKPEMKKKVMGTLLAGLGVFGLFVAGIVFLELRTTRISSLKEVVEGLNLRVVGNLPIMPRSAANGKNSWHKRKDEFWRSVLTESIDSTRTVLLNDAKVDSLKTIMITSATPGEGKSTLCCHLATSLARAGRNVLLIDCDLRRPSISRVFDLPASPGVCEVMRGESNIEDCLHSVESTGLSILTAGKINRKVLQMLAEGHLGELLEELKSQFDFIVVDSSPLLQVNDSMLLAQHVDGILFSIRKDVSRASKVSAAHHRLSMLGVSLLGAVVIGIDTDGDYRTYSYSRYGYGYHSVTGLSVRHPV